MTPEMQATTQNIQEMTDFIVNQALATAQQVQQGAEQVQEGSFVPQQPPVQATTNPSGPFTSGGLFMFGLGALAALGLAYWYIKRGK
jgi:hypothetical protein